jgi:capsule biosynthesis phosphatase
LQFKYKLQFNYKLQFKNTCNLYCIMKFIILCGGIGKRCNNYSLPKPLNLIQGRHMIEYAIENIPSNDVYIIYNIFLNDYNFREIIINKFKNKTIHFASVDYLTRGAVETAYIGMKQLNVDDTDNIVFIDNDNIHTINELPRFENDFIGYGIDYYNPNYSFIQTDNNNVIGIEEKNKISDKYCCGFYGFKNASTFNMYSKLLLDNNYKTKNEFYFSQLYKLIIADKKTITPVLIDTTKHIGSYNEIVNNTELVAKNKLRICFDLDNTLVTYPTIINDYSSVKPIHKNIQLLNNLKNDGHEIIIHTARRMATHKGNIGKVIKDIAAVTINTLDKFDIHYDELIFGKPIADIYVDDRAINPYINNISHFGLFYKSDEFIPNKIENNKYNQIKRVDNFIIKSGPYDIIKGELFYYQNIPPEFQCYFSKLIDFNKNDDVLELKMDYISGIPLYYLYKNQLLTTKIIDDLFGILNKFHSYKTLDMTITAENVKNNYILKLKNRFNTSGYNFNNAPELLAEIVGGIEENFDPVMSSLIHGDFWFSNIILTYDDNYKLIDMKGQVDNILTLNGDIYYDYGKLYQSILGYDLILNGQTVNIEYINSMQHYFLEKCKSLGLNLTYLRYVTKGLIFGTLYFITDSNTAIKNNIMDLIKTI